MPAINVDYVCLLKNKKKIKKKASLASKKKRKEKKLLTSLNNLITFLVLPFKIMFNYINKIQFIFSLCYACSYC